MVLIMTDPDLAVLNKEPVETDEKSDRSGEDGAEKPEVALSKEEAPYRALLEQLPAVIFMVPLDGTTRELYVSPHIQKMLGFSAQEWRDNPALWSQHLHPEDRAQWLADLARAQKAGEHFRSVYRFLDRDGRVVWIRGEANVVGDEAGHPLLLQGVAFDISEMKQTEAKLRAGEAWARSIVEHSYNALIAIDAAGLITDWNPQAELTFGWSRDEVLGRSVAETIIPLQYRELHQNGLRRFLATGEGPVLNKRIEITALHRDGHEFPVELTISPIRIGETYFFSAFVRDITERKESEEQLRLSEERARLTIDTAFDAHITIEARGLISDWNPQAERTFGWTRDEVIGRSVADTIIPPQFRASHNKGLQRFLDTGEGPVLNKRIEITALHRDGHEFPVEMTIAPIRLGETYLFSAFIKDITERKQAEEKLKQLNAHLALARDQALEANRAKSAFLANMSHELRTPLNAIIGFSEMLQEDALAGGHQSFVPDLQKIHGSAKHLLNLIGGILDLSKVEAGRMELFLETFDLATVIQEVVTTVQPLVEKNGNALELRSAADLGSINADVTKVRQVLFNLLSNAAKFTERGTITLEASRVTSPKAAWIHVSVRDTGIGMTPEQKDKLFQSFAQGDDSTTRKFGGTGLGLTICERFCDMMGGTIRVESELGKGSTFTIRLPVEVGAIREQPKAGPLESNAPTNSLQRPEADNSVLVIDNDPQVLELTRRYLIKEEWRILTATNGDDGLQLAKKLLPAAITVNLTLADRDGWEVLMALQADPALADIPVILFTLKVDTQRGYVLGASQYVNKPINTARLSSLLRNYQGEKPLRQALIIDDDPGEREALSRLVAKERWSVSEAADILAAMKCVAEVPPDLILLDLMLNSDALELVRILRNTHAGRSIPVVVVAPKELTEHDRGRLSGSVDRMLQKATFSRDDLLQEIRSLVAPYVHVRQRPRPNNLQLENGRESTEVQNSTAAQLAVEPSEAELDTRPIQGDLDTQPARSHQPVRAAEVPPQEELLAPYGQLQEEADRVRHLIREQQQSIELLRAECTEAWAQLNALCKLNDQAGSRPEIAALGIHKGPKLSEPGEANGGSHRPDGNGETWFLVYEKTSGKQHMVTGSSEEIRRWLQKGLLEHPSRVRVSRPGIGILEPLFSFPEFRDLEVRLEPAPPLPTASSPPVTTLLGTGSSEARLTKPSPLPSEPVLVASPGGEAVIARQEWAANPEVKSSRLIFGQSKRSSSERRAVSARSSKLRQRKKDFPEWLYWLILMACGVGTALVAGHYLFPFK
jgi:PAS domain S-box-containing protein